MKVYQLVDTEGDAAVDMTVALAMGAALDIRSCSQCTITDITGHTAYDDGLCWECREQNDRLLFANVDEGNRLIARIRSIAHPSMSSGQVLAMAANILRTVQ